MFYEKYLELCSNAKKTPTSVALEIGVSRGAVTNWKKGAMPNDITLKKIADYFNVSINFLLENDNQVTVNGNVSGTYNVFGNRNPQLNIKEEMTSQERELISVFRKLSEIGKAKILIHISEFEEKERATEK